MNDLARFGYVEVEAMRNRDLTVAESQFDDVPIIVHSHLRWDFVWQRPQQILSRMAQHHPVLFLEEPVSSPDESRLIISSTRSGVIRAVPAVPREIEDPDAKIDAVVRLLVDAVREDPALVGRFDSPVHWFYSPMTARAVLESVESQGVVYDCMDELANFKFAPPTLAVREQFLLQRADLVFTGGFALYQAKSTQHRNTHFFGCGVDVQHFARAHDPNTPVPEEVSSLPKPVLGYFGVIDERLDYELIELLAKQMPLASVVMVGPAAKVRPKDLPSLSNIHWLGQRSYSELPALVKGFDVCLMPFALNAATQFINPTKTLEYLAAGKPVVSTAVPDVVHGFSDLVEIGASRPDFVARIQQSLGRSDPLRTKRGLERAQAASWESIVASMRGHLLRTLEERDSHRGDGDRSRSSAASHDQLGAQP
jgi:hypothetical protein